jgi:molybdopterin-guanine dinucleotide biosynthesis protein A
LRGDQRTEPVRAALPGIVDGAEGAGPAAGLLAAHAACPQAAWLVLACDLPQLQASTLETVIRARDGIHAAIAYRSAVDGLPEPLCALWEPAALAHLSQQAQAGRYGLRDALQSVDALLLAAPANGELDNINTPQEWQRIGLPITKGGAE